MENNGDHSCVQFLLFFRNQFFRRKISRKGDTKMRLLMEEAENIQPIADDLVVLLVNASFDFFELI